MFEEFPDINKAAWLAEISKSLKGKSLESLDWCVSGDFVVNPLVCSEDFSALPLPLDNFEGFDWEICEIQPPTPEERRSGDEVEALAFGASALQFNLESLPSTTELAALFKNIFPEYISLHFSGKAVMETSSAVFALLNILCQERKLETQKLKGTLDFDPQNSPNFKDWRYVNELVLMADEHYSDIRTLVCQANDLPRNQFPEQLATLLASANFYFEKLTKLGLSPKQVAQTLHLKITIGTNYFLEIAKIRALKILWFNVLRAWGLPESQPYISAELDKTAWTSDVYSNMIRATTMSMSAIGGGVNRLTVLPFDAGFETENQTWSPAFSHRIARNVQHLLKMESHFGEISDPAAGSFYVEKLTAQIAEKAWKLFQNQ